MRYERLAYFIEAISLYAEQLNDPTTEQHDRLLISAQLDSLVDIVLKKETRIIYENEKQLFRELERGE